MSVQIAVWLLVGLAVIAANLPWISDRFLLVITPADRRKKAWMRLLEWLLLAIVVGVTAIGLERKATGGVHEQDWEFYAVGLFLFMVFAIPGFIWRHQWLPYQQRGRRSGASRTTR